MNHAKMTIWRIRTSPTHFQLLTFSSYRKRLSVKWQNRHIYVLHAFLEVTKTALKTKGKMTIRKKITIRKKLSEYNHGGRGPKLNFSFLKI